MIGGVVSEQIGGQRDRKLRVHRMFSRIGGNHQIFPVDGHRVAFGGQHVNAYSVNLLIWMHQGDRGTAEGQEVASD